MLSFPRIFHTLRFRLSAFVLIAVVVAAAVAAVAAFQVFSRYVKTQTEQTLRRQAAGIAELYSEGAVAAITENRAVPRFAGPLLEKSTGARIYYQGVALFPGQQVGLRPLPGTVFNWREMGADQKQFTLRLPGQGAQFAVARRVKLGGQTFGALVVAKPVGDVHRRVLTLMSRTASMVVAFLMVAVLLFVYLSRRLTRPLRELEQAAEKVAAGDYSVGLPPKNGVDEIDRLWERFREMAGQLEQTNELARQFLMKVSHELRTPLTSIGGHAEALLDDFGDDPKVRESSLKVILQEQSRLGRLVADLLDLSKLQARRFVLHEEEVPLEDLCTHAFESFRPEAERRNIDFEKLFSATPVVMTDGDRLLQVVMNLLSNAFEWTPDGGLITLALEHDGEEIIISVEDTGPGIPTEEHDKVIVPFWSQNRRGTGLGLAIAHELSEALGGRLRFYSEPGRGSRFTVALPSGQHGLLG